MMASDLAQATAGPIVQVPVALAAKPSRTMLPAFPTIST